MSILMPFSPLDALINALPEVRKAGRVRKGDTGMTVDQRIAEVYRPIVQKTQQRYAEELLKFIRDIAGRSTLDCGGEECSFGHYGCDSDRARQLLKKYEAKEAK